MTIDAQQHFWNYDPVRDAWIDARMTAIRRDFLPGDIRPTLLNNDVAGCVAVQASQSPAETEYLLDLADRSDFILGVVGWVDLQAAGVGEQLATYAAHPKFVGVRHLVQAEASGFMLTDKFQRGISALQPLGLTYDLLVLDHQLPEAIELARAFPSQHFVLDHIAKPRVSEGMSSTWAGNIERLAALPEVYCKLSGLVTETSEWKWKWSDFTAFIHHAMECFGPDRLMFGSDWPVCTLAASYAQVMEIVSAAIADLPPADREKIMGGNARRFYGL